MDADGFAEAFKAAFEAQRTLAPDADTTPLRVVFYTADNADFARAIPASGGEHVWTFPVSAEAWRFMLYCMQHLQLELGAPVDQVIVATDGDAGYFLTAPGPASPDADTNVGGVSGNQTPASFGAKAKMFMSSAGTFTVLTNRFAGAATYYGTPLDGKTVMQDLADAIGGFVFAADGAVLLTDAGAAETSGAQWLATHGATRPAESAPPPSSGTTQITLGPQS